MSALAVLLAAACAGCAGAIDLDLSGRIPLVPNPAQQALDLSDLGGAQPVGVALVLPRNGSTVSTGLEQEFDVVFDAWGVDETMAAVVELNADTYDIPVRQDGPRNTISMRAMMPMAWHELRVTVVAAGGELARTQTTHFFLVDDNILTLKAQAPSEGFALPVLLPNPGAPPVAYNAETTAHDEGLYVARFFDEAECDVLIADADATPFESDFHPTRPTWDHDGRFLRRAAPIIANSFVHRIAPAIENVYGIPAYMQFPNEVFLVRYDMDTAQSIHSHADGSIVSVNILLNSPDEFTGGGTWFAAGNRLVAPSARGHGIFNRGWMTHAGLPITSGARYILVVFVAVQDLARGIALQRQAWYFRSLHGEWNADIARGPEFELDSRGADTLRSVLEHGPPDYAQRLQELAVAEGRGAGRWFEIARPIVAGGPGAGAAYAAQHRADRADPNKQWTLEELMGAAGFGHRWGSPPSDALMVDLYGSTRVFERQAVLLPREGEVVSGFGNFVKLWICWPANHQGSFQLHSDGILLPAVDTSRLPATFDEDESSLELSHRFLSLNMEDMRPGDHTFSFTLTTHAGEPVGEPVVRHFTKV